MNATVEEGDLVATVTLLTHRHEMGREIVLPGTCGIVTETHPNKRFVRVDFTNDKVEFEPWVSPNSLRIVEEQLVSFEPATPEAVSTLWDIVSAQGREIQRLQKELSALLKKADATLVQARAGSDDHA